MSIKNKAAARSQERPSINSLNASQLISEDPTNSSGYTAQVTFSAQVPVNIKTKNEADALSAFLLQASAPKHPSIGVWMLNAKLFGPDGLLVELNCHDFSALTEPKTRRV